MICIDPGLRGVGLAVFGGNELTYAFYVTNPVKTGRGYRAHVSLAREVRAQLSDTHSTWLIEHPVIYPGMPQKDLNDLLDVVAVGAACAMKCAGFAETVFPSEWKGNMPKQKMLERIRSKLTPEEVARVEWTNKSDNEDVLDAIGIGLWKLGRLNSKVYPGATK